jgi:hypothetical protein
LKPSQQKPRFINTKIHDIYNNPSLEVSIIGKPKIKAGEKPSVKYAAYVAGVLEKKGEKELGEAQHELGAKYAKAQLAAHKIKGKDARAAGAVYDNLLRELEIEHSIIEDTNKRFVVQARECPFLDEWRKKEADESKLCESFGKSFVQGICRGVNPRLRYSVTKMMSRGDAYCEERIKLA